MNDPIRLFVGTSANGEDREAEAVLEYTARKHCSLPIDITWMRQAAKGPWSGWRSSASGRTTFSAFRWSVPAVCNFQGKAIYTDVDFFFLADIAELWHQDVSGSHVMLMKGPDGKLNYSSSILFDCAKCQGHVPSLDRLRKIPDAHSDMLAYFRPRREQLIGGMAGDWNCQTYEKMRVGATVPLDLSEAKAYHFTRIEHQLHLRYAVPRLKAEGRSHWYTGAIGPHPHGGLIDLYDTLYREALAAGYTPDRYPVEAFDGATRRNFTYTHSRVTA